MIARLKSPIVALLPLDGGIVVVESTHLSFYDFDTNSFTDSSQFDFKAYSASMTDGAIYICAESSVISKFERLDGDFVESSRICVNGSYPVKAVYSSNRLFAIFRDSTLRIWGDDFTEIPLDFPPADIYITDRINIVHHDGSVTALELNTHKRTDPDELRGDFEPINRRTVRFGQKEFYVDEDISAVCVANGRLVVGCGYVINFLT